MRLWLRSLAFNIIFFTAGIGFGTWSLITQLKGPAHITRMGQAWARISLRALRLLCNIEIEITGREYLPQSGPALIAAQHQSAFDIYLWLALLPEPAYVLKRELTKMPVFGVLLLKAGFIAVDRDGGAASLRKMVLECRAAVASGRQIVIFPEGTRVAPGQRGSIQPGIVALARALKLPVIPVSTDSGKYWGKNAFKKSPGKLKVNLHPAIPATAGRQELIDQLELRYYEKLVDNSVR